MPIACGEQLEHDVEGAAEISEAQPTVILEIIRGWSVRTDLKRAEGSHAYNSIQVPVVGRCIIASYIYSGIPEFRYIWDGDLKCAMPII